jgi:hypothetical protein
MITEINDIRLIEEESNDRLCLSNDTYSSLGILPFMEVNKALQETR